MFYIFYSVFDFNSNRYKTSIEFIINHRKALEKANIVPWINNIFGCNQINDSKELMNLFPKSSYEQLFNDNVAKIKEIGNAMRKASLCGLGQTAPNPVLSTMKFFKNEYDALLVDGNEPDAPAKKEINACNINTKR